MMDDATLLRRYAETRSEEAFAEVVRRYIDMVYSAALRRTGEPHRAADVVQQVFTFVAHNAGTLARHPVLSGWLYTATRNAALNAARSELRRRHHEEQAQLVPVNATLEPAVDWEQLRPLLDAAMDELAGADRNAVLWRFFEQRSYAEIGTALRVSEDAARMRTDRALDKLRHGLANRGITSTSSALGSVLVHHSISAAPAGLATSTIAAASGGMGIMSAASAAVADAAGWFYFMKTTTLIIAAAITLAAIGVAWSKARDARAARGALALAEQSHATLTRRAHQADETIAQMQKDLVARARQDSTAPGAPVPAGAVPAPAAAITAATVIMMKAGLPAIDFTQPDLRMLVVKDRALRTRVQFDQFFGSNDLAPAQQEKFLEILTERDQGLIDLVLTMQPLAPTPENNRTQGNVAQQIFRDTDGKLRALLGDATYQQFKQFSATLPDRPIVEQLAGRLTGTLAPLTAEQAVRLTEILATNRFAIPRPNAGPPAMSLGGTPITLADLNAGRWLASQRNMEMPYLISDQAVQRAGQILSEPQLMALRQQQAQQVMELKVAAATFPFPESRPTSRGDKPGSE